MTRLFLLALFVAFALVTPAAAQASKVCDGNFERFLAGYTIGEEEIDALLHDDAAIAACRAQLDAGNREHRLIDAFIQRRRKTGTDEPKAARLFDALCTEGSKLACFYKMPWWKPGVTPERDAAEIARLQPMLATNLPAVATKAGVFMARRDWGTERRAMALRLLRSASGQGDYWATYELALAAGLDGNQGQQLALIRKAAEQGLVASWLKLADYQVVTVKDRAAGFALFHRAAGANPTFFRPSVAHAQFMVGRMLRDGDGVERDPVQAQRWLESAAALGNTHATRILQKK